MGPCSVEMTLLMDLSHGGGVHLQRRGRGFAGAPWG